MQCYGSGESSHSLNLNTLTVSTEQMSCLCLGSCCLKVYSNSVNGTQKNQCSFKLRLCYFLLQRAFFFFTGLWSFMDTPSMHRISYDADPPGSNQALVEWVGSWSTAKTESKRRCTFPSILVLGKHTKHKYLYIYNIYIYYIYIYTYIFSSSIKSRSLPKKTATTPLQKPTVQTVFGWGSWCPPTSWCPWWCWSVPKATRPGLHKFCGGEMARKGGQKLVWI